MTECLHILYVDDDDDIRMIVGMALSLDPVIDVRTVGSAAAALRIADEDRWHPDAIILDVMMPDMDGIALLSALRRRPKLAATPAVFMTARSYPSDTAGPPLDGALGVILKPFDPIELAGTVRRLLAHAA